MNADVHSVTITGASLTAALWPSDPAKAKEVSGQLAMWIREVVDHRVFEEGRDANGRLFKAYTRPYAAWKLKHRGGSFSGPEVNMQLTGAMRRAFRVKNIRARSGRVGPTGRTREYAVHVDAERPWVEMSKAEADRIPEVVARICERVNGGRGRGGPGAGGRIV
jgi:hypothetical protein